MKTTTGKNFFYASVALLALGMTLSALAQDKEALTLQLPAPTLKGTPEQLPTGPNIEANSDKAPPALNPLGFSSKATVEVDATVASSKG